MDAVAGSTGKRVGLAAMGCAILVALMLVLPGCGQGVRDSDVVGTYSLTSLKSNGAMLDDTQAAALKAKGLELIMSADRYYAIGLGDEVRFYGSWTLEGGKVRMANNAETVMATWEKSVLTLTSGSTEMSFTKDADTAALPASLQQQLGISDKK